MIAFHTLAYPFLTIQRRVEAGSRELGMLPKKSSFGTIADIWRTQGLRAFWAGYPAHLFAVLIWMSIIP